MSPKAEPKYVRVTFKNASQKVKIYQGSNGHYRCPGCGKYFPSAWSMNRHAPTHEAPEELDQSGPSTAGAATSDGVQTPNELVSDEFLESIGYVVNTRGRFLICTGCRKPVLPSFTSGHSHEQHKMARFDINLLQPYIRAYNLFETAGEFERTFFPPPDKPPVLHVAFDGVDITPAYSCSKCTHARGTVDSLETHWRGSHEGVSFQQPKLAPAQSIYLCPQFGRWLPVRIRMSSDSVDDALQALVDAYLSLPEGLQPPDTNAREPPPWLRKLGWLQWISGYDSGLVDDFVLSVKADPLFKRLSEALTSYLERAMNVLCDMPPQIRQILRSVTEVIKPLMFNAPDSDGTIERYAGIMTFVILAHLRLQAHSSPPLPKLLNPKQSDLVETLRVLLAQDEVPHSVLDETLHNVLMALVIHQFEGSQLKVTSDPVIMALVWYNRKRDGSFKQPGDITQTFAAVQFLARSAAVMHIFTRTELSEGATDYYQEMAKLHPLMLQGSGTPLGNIYGYWVILLKAAMEEIGFADFLFTSDDDMSFAFKSMPGTVDGLRRMIWHHVDGAEKTLFKDILFDLDFPLLSQLGDHIYDDTSNVDVDYSFLTDKRNRYPDGFTCFMQTVLGAKNPSLHKFFGFRINDVWVWSRPNCLQWLESCQRFLEHLLISSHMTHGQPTRGTEILSTTFANMANYPRSIFYVADEGVNGLAPNKGESMTQQRKLSPHYFCPQNSRQLFIYLLLVRPVEIAIAKAILPKAATNYQYYLYTGPKGRWNTKAFTALLRSSSKRFLGAETLFGLSEMRQVLIAIYHRHCNSLYSESESKTVTDAFAEDLGDRQANHSSQTRRAHYGVQKSEMGAIPSEKVRAIRMYSRGIHNFWKVGNSHSNNTETTMPDLGTNVDHKAILVAVQHELNDVKEAFRISSTEMKKWLAESLQTSVADSANAIVRAMKDDTAPIPSYDHIPSARLLATLRKWNPAYTNFRSDEQALALARVLERKEHQLVILPTGEGKSMLWMLPSQTCWLNKVVIAVIPFVALMLDLEGRLRTMGITYSHWPPRNDRPTLDHGIVFVSAEQAVTVNFYRFALGLVNRGLLACIVLDECHLVLTASNYRKGLPHLKNLFGLGQPVLCTTATLPPHLVPMFKSVLEISQIQVTRRVNKYASLRIAVDVKKNSEERMEAVIKKAKEWLPILHRRRQSAFIICRTVTDCEDIAASLGVEPYHGSLSAELKVERLKRFQTGQENLLVATTALAVGVSFENAVAVVLNGPTHDMLTAVQAIGRVGRGSTTESAFCYIVVDVRQRSRPMEEDILGVGALDAMIFDRTVCRKLPLTAFVEGTVTSCLSNKLLCDVCQEMLEREGCKYEGPRDLVDTVNLDALQSVESYLGDYPEDKERERRRLEILESERVQQEVVAESAADIYDVDVYNMDSGFSDIQEEGVGMVSVNKGKGRMEDGEGGVVGVSMRRSKRSREDLEEDEPLWSARSVRPRIQSAEEVQAPTPVFPQKRNLGKVLVPDTPPLVEGVQFFPSPSPFDFGFTSSFSIGTGPNSSHSEYIPSQGRTPYSSHSLSSAQPSSSPYTQAASSFSALSQRSSQVSSQGSSQRYSQKSLASSALPFPSSPAMPLAMQKRPSYLSLSSHASPSSYSTSSLPPSPSISTAMQRQQTQGRKKETMECQQAILFVLEKLKGTCILCLLKKDILEDGHVSVGCSMVERNLMFQRLKGLSVPTETSRDYLCYSCFLPKKRPGFTVYAHGESWCQDKCDLAHIMRPLIWGCWHFEDYRTGLVEYFHPCDKEGKGITEEREWKKFFDWCFRKHKKIDEFVNCLLLLLWATRRSKAFMHIYGVKPGK